MSTWTYLSLDKVRESIIKNLSDDLLSKEWLSKKKSLKSCDPTYGHCYVATECAYHFLGGKRAGWKPCHLKCQDGSHWFLKHSSGLIFDVTEGQFEGDEIPYHQAKGMGFLTRRPSKRAWLLLERIRKNWARLDA